jgi:hypothetical protein
MSNCPKCNGFFSINYRLCDFHQRDYDDWLNKEYFPQECKCGCSEWIDGTLQMTDPPSLPEKAVWRCSQCKEIRLERSREGTVRLMTRSK